MSENIWKGTAELIAEDALAIKPEEKVVLVVGEGVEKVDVINDIYSAIKEVFEEKGLNFVTFSYKSEPGLKVPELLETVCLEADVIITLYVRGLLHSDAWPRIREGRKPTSRLLMLPNGNRSNYIERNLPKTKEEFYEISDITRKYGSQFLGNHTVHLTAKNGTDLTMKVGQLAGWNHDGIGTAPGSFIILPAGTLNQGVDRGSAEGKLVVNCYTALKNELMNEAITFDVHDGYATNITGGQYAKDFLDAADVAGDNREETLCIAEFGLGFVKNADIRVCPSESEDMYGVAHIGIGSNGSFGGDVMIDKWHIDCIIEDASVELDGKTVLIDGEYCE